MPETIDFIYEGLQALFGEVEMTLISSDNWGVPGEGVSRWRFRIGNVAMEYHYNSSLDGSYEDYQARALEGLAYEYVRHQIAKFKEEF